MTSAIVKSEMQIFFMHKLKIRKNFHLTSVLALRDIGIVRKVQTKQKSHKPERDAVAMAGGVGL